jgi:hypothetical protein
MLLMDRNGEVLGFMLTAICVRRVVSGLSTNHGMFGLHACELADCCLLEASDGSPILVQDKPLQCKMSEIVRVADCGTGVNASLCRVVELAQVTIIVGIADTAVLTYERGKDKW